MPGTGAGWDSCLYRVFIVGGLLAVVTGVVVSVMLTPDDSQVPLYVGVGGMAVFMVVVVGYWALQIIIKGYGSPKAADPNLIASVNDLSILGDWNKLFAAMTIHGGNPEKLKKMEKQGRSTLVIWYGWAAAIGLGPIALMLPYIFGLVEWGTIRYGVYAYLGLVALMAAATPFFMRRSVEANQAIYLAPLGLTQTALPEVGLIPSTDGPRPAVRGASVIEGKRFGRAVRIELDLLQVTTMVRAKIKPFTIRSQQGDLVTETNTPPAVVEALKSLRKAKRWQGLEMHGDVDGIVAVRPKRGVNMWLYDLWLIERILKEMQEQSNS